MPKWPGSRGSCPDGGRKDNSRKNSVRPGRASSAFGQRLPVNILRPHLTEGWQSGRMHRLGKAAGLYGSRRFESGSLRQTCGILPEIDRCAATTRTVPTSGPRADQPRSSLLRGKRNEGELLASAFTRRGASQFPLFPGRWQSGRMHRFRKPANLKGFRGFKSLPARQYHARTALSGQCRLMEA